MSINLHCFIFASDKDNDLKLTFDSIKEDCSAISILSRNFIEEFNYFISFKSGIHHVFNLGRSYLDEINDLVREIDSDYYLILESGTIVNNIKSTLEKYLEKNKLALIKPYKEGSWNGLLVQSFIHLWLHGNQEQNIMEKIIIKSINDGQENMILNNLDELYRKVNNE